MLKRILFLVCLLSAGALRAAPSFPALLDAYYEEYLALYPIDAAGFGDSDRRYEAVWPIEIGAEHRAKVAAMCDKYLAQLAQVDRAALSLTDQLSYDTLKWSLTARREQDAQFFYLLPVNQFSCPTLTFAQLASGKGLHPFKTEQDFRNFISRALGFSTWVDTAIANMKEGVAKGIVQPRILMERVLPQLEPLMTDDRATNILFGPLEMLPAGLAGPAKDKLVADYTAAIHDIMIPAYRRLDAYIKTDYLPHCRTTAGIGALPGGAAAYASAVRWNTTTDFTPEQI